jgi:AraC-like DNA-binding protein
MTAAKVADFLIAEGNDPVELAATLSLPTVKLTARPVNKTGILYKCRFTNAGALSIGLNRYQGQFSITREGVSDLCLIFLPRYGNAVFHAGGKEIVSSGRQGVIADCAQYESTLFLGAREHFVIIIDRNTLSNGLSDMLEIPISGSLNFRPEIDLTAGAGVAITRIAATLQAGLVLNDGPLRSAPLALASLTDALTQMILETLPHRFSEELHRPFYPLPRHVKRAIEFMEANLSKPLSIQDIAGGCGVSVRTLHQGFRQFKVTTPIAHLQHLRLEAVHKELRYAEPGQTVAEIALKWGFTHMGRFASDYRKRFGQLPSATLRS